MTNRRRAAGTGQILPGVLLLVAGVLITVAAPGLWAMTHQDPALRPIGAGVAVELAQASTVRPVTATSLVTPSPTPPGAVGRAAATPRSASSPGARSPVAPGSPVSKVQSRARTAVPTTRVSATAAPRTGGSSAGREVGTPVRLRIPAIGVDAPVESVGVDAAGEMAIPEQVQQIGWYRYGAAPGAPVGSVVMSGHVDSAEQGLGVFHDLGALRAGDHVEVADSAGHQLRYRVVSREAFDKNRVPLADLFSRKGSARLTLITCGGGFDPAKRSYLDNIVVTAVPA